MIETTILGLAKGTAEHSNGLRVTSFGRPRVVHRRQAEPTRRKQCLGDGPVQCSPPRAADRVVDGNLNDRVCHLVPKVGAVSGFCDESGTTEMFEALAQLRHRAARDPTQIDRIDSAVDDGKNFEDALISRIEDLQIQIDAFAQRFGKPNETRVGEVGFLFEERSEKPDHKEWVSPRSLMKPPNERFGNRPSRLSLGSEYLAGQLGSLVSRERLECRARQETVRREPRQDLPGNEIRVQFPGTNRRDNPDRRRGKTPRQIAQCFPR